MKKAFLALAFVFSAIAVNAQVLYVWDGDMRFGITAGVGTMFGKPDITIKMPSKRPDFIQEKLTSKISPSIGIYSGMQKDLSDNITFAYNNFINLTFSGYNGIFKSPAGVDTTVTFSTNDLLLKGTELVSIGYKLNDDFELFGEVGLNVLIHFPLSKTIETSIAGNSSGEETIKSSGFNMEFGAGLAVGAGACYYLTDAIFVRGDIVFNGPYITSAYIDEKFFGDDYDDFFTYKSTSNASMTALHKSYNALLLQFTIGVRW